MTLQVAEERLGGLIDFAKRANQFVHALLIDKGQLTAERAEMVVS